MTYGSVCSGIEAASVAWMPIGFQASFFSEIDPACSSLLSYRYPSVKNYGNFTQIPDDTGAIDILVGGTPCQSFSIAGLRGGLDDPRGNLALEFIELVRRLRPRWVVWENVVGVTSSASHDAPDPVPPDGGMEGRTTDKYDSEEISDFGIFLSRLSECGYGYCWRTLDAQSVGGCALHADEFGIGPVPQRRRRVFVVARSGILGESADAQEIPDVRRAMFLSAAVLLERESLLWDSSACREARQGVAGSFGGGTGTRGWCDDTDRTTFVADQARTISAGEAQRQDWETCTFVAHSITAEGFDASEDGTGRGTPLVCGTIESGINKTGGTRPPGTTVDTIDTLVTCFDPENITSPGNRSNPQPGDPTGSIHGFGGAPCIAFQERGREGGRNLEYQEDVAYSINNPGAGGRRQELNVCIPILEAGARTGKSTDDIRAGSGIGDDGDPMFTIQSGKQHAVAFNLRGREGGAMPEMDDVVSVRASSGGSSRSYLAPAMGVRRLTPVEVERCFGFSGEYTLIPYNGKLISDSARYRMLGNSICVPVLRWVGSRIKFVDGIPL